MMSILIYGTIYIGTNSITSVITTNYSFYLNGTAATATYAINAGTATMATTATSATYVSYATNAGTATSATVAMTASNVLNAPDSPALTQLPNATMQFYAAMNTNLSNAQWELVQAARQNNFLSFNSHGLVNTAKKIATGKQISIEVDGSGFDGIHIRLFSFGVYKSGF